MIIDQDTGGCIRIEDSPFRHFPDGAGCRRIVVRFGSLPGEVIDIRRISRDRFEKPFLSLKDLPFSIDGLKKIPVFPDAFGCAQKKNPARVQGMVKQGNDFFLQDTVHIDNEISATHQVQPGKGRILFACVHFLLIAY